MGPMHFAQVPGPLRFSRTRVVVLDGSDLFLCDVALKMLISFNFFFYLYHQT